MSNNHLPPNLNNFTSYVSQFPGVEWEDDYDRDYYYRHYKTYHRWLVDTNNIESVHSKYLYQGYVFNLIYEFNKRTTVENTFSNFLSDDDLALVKTIQLNIFSQITCGDFYNNVYPELLEYIESLMEGVACREGLYEFILSEYFNNRNDLLDLFESGLMSIEMPPPELDEDFEF